MAQGGGPKEKLSCKMILAIDGPAGSGKSTIARLVARRLGFLYVDTGAMYRALTLKAISEGLDLEDQGALKRLCYRTNIDLRMDKDYSLKVYLDGKDVTERIRTLGLTRKVSYIAKVKEVRAHMATLQRHIGKQGNVVLEGRDIGTVIFPEANKKIYLDAQLVERVKRRYKELKKINNGISRFQVEKEIRGRDESDITRKIAPLRKARDALYIDTTNMSIREVVDKILCSIGCLDQ